MTPYINTPDGPRTDVLSHIVNTSRPMQNGSHFTDGLLKCIFLNKNILISIKMSLKFVRKGPINNIPVFVQIMAWHRPGDNPLSEPVMVILPTHICITRLQKVKMHSQIDRFSAAEIGIFREKEVNTIATGDLVTMVFNKWGERCFFSTSKAFNHLAHFSVKHTNTI